MGRVTIAYYVVRGGRGYWQPNAKMVRNGAKCVACGPDGPDAWRKAKEANEAWHEKTQAVRNRSDFPLVPRGTLAAAFAEYRPTPEWAAKAPRTREEWDRCWSYIEPAFGGCRPSQVTLAQISGFRAMVERNVSLREAQRTIKIWRALWIVAAALKYCERGADPSLGVRNPGPQTRSATWTHLEAARLVKAAWRSRYTGLAALIATAWDTSFSPVDSRRLTTAQLADGRFVVVRAKTGISAIGTLSRASQKVLNAYLGSLGVAITPAAPIFRNRSGRAYSKDTLGDDFRIVRALAFGPDERRTLADFRRSGVVEAVRGGAESGQIGAKLGNQFDKSAFLRRTYSPVDLAAVRAADEARKRGRK